MSHFLLIDAGTAALLLTAPTKCAPSKLNESQMLAIILQGTQRSHTHTPTDPIQLLFSWIQQVPFETLCH